MKKTNRPMRLFRNALAATLLLAGITITANAASVINAGRAEFLLPGAPSDLVAVNSMNTDMVQHHTKGERLVATVYEGVRNGGIPYNRLVIQDFGTYPSSVDYILPPTATNFDVAIVNNMGSSYNIEEDYIIMITWEDAGQIYYEISTVEDLGATFITTSIPGTGTAISPAGITCHTPHIDASGNVMYPIYGSDYYALDQFAIVWEQEVLPVPFTINGIYGLVGFWKTTSLGTPSVLFGAVTPLIPGDYVKPDVACRGWRTAPPPVNWSSRTIYVSALSTGNTDVVVASFDADRLSNITSGVSLITQADGFNAGVRNDNPRIECVVVGDDVPGSISELYQVVMESDVSGFWEIHAFSEQSTTPAIPTDVYNLGIPVSFTGNHYRPVVTGVGFDCNASYSNIYSQNENFTTSYYSEYTNIGPDGGTTEGDYFANVMDYHSIPSPTYPDYYEINTKPLFASFSTSVNTPCIATTSSSNTGYELFSVWYHGWNGTSGNIKYKFNSDTYTYKTGTTSVNNINAEKNYAVFPNPATTTLTVNGTVKADYTIVDVVGKTVAAGTISNSNNTVAIEKLTPGNYLLNLSENGHTTIVKFVKQ